MASYKDVLRMLRKGESPQRIVRLLDIRPSQWRRILSGKRFRDALRIEEDLASVIASHAVSLETHSAAEKFSELLASDKPETARKVALAILHQGLSRTKARQNGSPRPHARSDRMPWLGRERGRHEDSGGDDAQSGKEDDRRLADDQQIDRGLAGEHEGG